MSFRNHLLAAAAVAVGWSIIPAAYAQQEEELPPASMPEDRTPAQQATPAQEPTPPETAAPGTTASLDDKKIEQFADAYIAVQTIQKKTAADLQTTTDPKQADQVKAAAETDMIAAVERSGLQVEEFNRIVETMATNANVRSRIAAELQERTGGT